MQVDFKITVWERVEVPEEKKLLVLRELKKGKITNSQELIEFIEGSNFVGIIDDTGEQMTVEENDNQSTIEVISEQNETIWTNVEK